MMRIMNDFVYIVAVRYRVRFPAAAAMLTGLFDLFCRTAETTPPPSFKHSPTRCIT